VASIRGRPKAAQEIDGSGASAPAFDVVVIGASAGGLTALCMLLGELPIGFPAAVAVVLHLSPKHPSLLTVVLSRSTQLAVCWASDGASMTPGTVYVAPPNRHVAVDRNRVLWLLQSAPVHYSRPAVDVLFASAAVVFGRRTLAVILSGNGFDGSDGVTDVHDAGGIVIAQDEATSQFFGMPHKAIESGGVTYVLPASSIGAAVRRLVTLGIGAGVHESPPPVP
jgi:two-component system chemotaxis response regulator CheB